MSQFCRKPEVYKLRCCFNFSEKDNFIELIIVSRKSNFKERAFGASLSSGILNMQYESATKRHKS